MQQAILQKRGRAGVEEEGRTLAPAARVGMEEHLALRAAEAVPGPRRAALEVQAEQGPAGCSHGEP